jgi:hypothetical protein
MQPADLTSLLSQIYPSSQGDLDYEKGVVQRLTNEMRRLQSEKLDTTILNPRNKNVNNNNRTQGSATAEAHAVPAAAPSADQK